MSEQVPIRSAATVILVRDGAHGLETLLVRRAADLAFHGGSWVFPGGRIDDEDFSPRGSDDVETAARNAAVREAREEAGLVVDPDTLVPWAHWTTPPGRNRRFATWFYLAPAPDGSDDIVIDGEEIQDHRWFRPPAALEARRAGEIELPAPTFVSLLRLVDCVDMEAAIEHARRYPYLYFTPRPVRVKGGMISIYNGDAAFDPDPAYDGLDDPRITRPGPRHRLWMTDEEDWQYERTI
jgi:8-oxo-dGTP pyrophosphatase MutT (NUDIX family)